MSIKHPYRLPIPTLPIETERPIWSVMIPTYNCAGYLRETLNSVLLQDPGSKLMQIAVVDDFSTQDNPEAVVKELGQGRIEFYRQAENVGHIENFQTCLNLAKGKLVHLLHGDDCVRETFYSKMQQGFEQAPEIGAAFCRHIIMDENGHWQHLSVLEQSETGTLPHDWLELLIGFQRIQTPSMVVRREVYEKLGGFDYRVGCAEDWEMWIRIAEHFPIWYEVEPLALYRKHSNSNTGRSTRKGEHIRNMRKVIEVIQERNTKERMSKKFFNHSKQNIAFYAIKIANSNMNLGDPYSSFYLIREALKCNRSFRVIRSIGRIIIWNSPQWLWQTLFSTKDNS